MSFTSGNASLVSGNAIAPDADKNVRHKQIEQTAAELAVALRSDKTPEGEAWAKLVEGVAKAACET